MPDVQHWRSEDEQFWKTVGHYQTQRLPQMNLLLLLAGSSMWMIWAALTVLLLDVGYPFKMGELFGLMASAGVAGICMRLAGGFILHHCGTRDSILLTCLLLLMPLGLLAWALTSLDTPLWVFQLCAIGTGIGSGFISLIVSSNYYLFPLKMRSLVLEVPLALACVGLILVLVAVPMLVQWDVLQGLGLKPMYLLYDSSNISGRIPKGQPVWLLSSLLLPAVLLLLAVWQALRSPNVLVSNLQIKQKINWEGVLRSLVLVAVIFWFCAGYTYLDVLFPSFSHIPAIREVFIFLTILMVLFLMHRLANPAMQARPQQISLLTNKEAHILGLMYLMGMGSLLGFGVSFALLIKAVFAVQFSDDNRLVLNPVAPAVLIYGWLPVVFGLVARAGGSWLAQHMRPSLINHLALLMLFVSSLFMAYYSTQAVTSSHPEQVFFIFFSWALVFFVACGLSAGSVMNMALKTLPRQQLEAALGWILAVAAIGAYYIPRMYADDWSSTGPGKILLGFALFYLIGLLVNWYFYLRKSSRYSLF